MINDTFSVANSSRIMQNNLSKASFAAKLSGVIIGKVLLKVYGTTRLHSRAFLVNVWVCEACDEPLGSGKGPPTGEPQRVAILRTSVLCDTGRAHTAG